MIAALPMYDRPELAAAHDRYWAQIRDRLRAAGLHAPDALTRPMDLWALWRDPDLVLAQTCGLPFRTQLRGHVHLVGTPDYALPGCPPGFYNSVLVVRKGDCETPLAGFSGRRFAFNEPGSQSGWAAPVAHTPGLAQGPLIRTGSHRASAWAVADGRADIAAIDAQTWRLLTRYEAFASHLAEMGRTTPTPGLPYICAADLPVHLVSESVRGAIGALSDSDRALLGHRGLINIPENTYAEIPTPPCPMQPAT